MTKSGLIAIALLLGLAAPAAAADRSQLERDMQRMGDIARGAAEQLIGSFQQMLQAVPQYDAPKVLGNGDIIIRRKHDDEAARPAPKLPPRRQDEQEALRGGATDI